MVKDALESKSGYRDIVDQMKELRVKKNQLESSVKAEFSRELEKIDELKTSIKEAEATLSDAVLSALSRGEVVKIRDAYNATYDPVVKVSFKKSDEREE